MLLTAALGVLGVASGALAARVAEWQVVLIPMSVASLALAIEYNAAILKRARDTDRDILEILGVVDHYTTLNTLSEGMQIESDIRPAV